MNDRDEGIDNGISELDAALLFIRVLGGLQGGLCRHKEAAHGLRKVRLEVLLNSETQVTHGNHGMSFRLNRQRLVAEDHV